MDETPRIHIKLNIGEIEAEIDCPVENLKETVDIVLSSIQEKLKETTSQLLPSRQRVPTRKTCKDIATDLWLEKWFEFSRESGEVWEEMGRRGYHFDRSAVSHTLLDLVREGYLTRTGRPRSYKYIQKMPPPTGAK